MSAFCLQVAAMSVISAFLNVDFWLTKNKATDRSKFMTSQDGFCPEKRICLFHQGKVCAETMEYSLDLNHIELIWISINILKISEKWKLLKSIPYMWKTDDFVIINRNQVEHCLPQRTTFKRQRYQNIVEENISYKFQNTVYVSYE